ncbi:DUF3667 domain-containing protein [Haloflavibacter putidus]|uniref:DUF3667 domain-containing protein n=1 Tax=Haloflavibacter putidus TaxID=2576776 RepID=UPI001F2F22CD|nr:DUF3667 domain-containing protein [Haloflavibacter putidus]
MKKNKPNFKYRGEQCLNCGVPLYKTDRYCHYCGQLNSVKKLSLKSVLKEFFAGLFAYDSRIYKTFRKLLFQPGRLALDYVKGKRKTYVNPFRFFFSLAILFFILQSFQSDYFPTEESGFLNLKEANKTDEIDFAATNFKSTDLYKTEKELANLSFSKATKRRLNIYYVYHKHNKEHGPSIVLKNLDHASTTWNKFLFNKSKNFIELTENSKSFESYLYAKLPLFAFIIVPLLTLALWLIYYKTAYNYMEHLLFNYYLQAFNLILFGFFSLLTVIINADFPWFFFLLIYCWYFYKSLRNFYQQKTLKTIVKTVLLNVIFYILAAISILFSILGTFVIY